MLCQSGISERQYNRPAAPSHTRKVVSYLYYDASDPNQSAYLTRNHPDYAAGRALYRLSGTSSSAVVTAGVVALMLQHTPTLTPDQNNSRRTPLFAKRLAQTPNQGYSRKIMAPVSTVFLE